MLIAKSEDGQLQRQRQRQRDHQYEHQHQRQRHHQHQHQHQQRSSNNISTDTINSGRSHLANLATVEAFASHLTRLWAFAGEVSSLTTTVASVSLSQSRGGKKNLLAASVVTYSTIVLGDLLWRSALEICSGEMPVDTSSAVSGAGGSSQSLVVEWSPVG